MELGCWQLLNDFIRAYDTKEVLESRFPLKVKGHRAYWVENYDKWGDVVLRGTVLDYFAIFGCDFKTLETFLFLLDQVPDYLDLNSVLQFYAAGDAWHVQPTSDILSWLLELGVNLDSNGFQVSITNCMRVGRSGFSSQTSRSRSRPKLYRKPVRSRAGWDVYPTILRTTSWDESFAYH
jgi:hypothetical protein